MVDMVDNMQIVDQRDATTLLPTISDHIEAGTTVWSDMWAAYNGVAALLGVAGHKTVSKSFSTDSQSCNWSSYKHYREVIYFSLI